MHKFLSLLFTCSLLLSPMLVAKEIAGIVVEPQFKTDEGTLMLQGSGIRDKFFMDMYVASLYTSQAYPKAEDIVKADEPMSLSLHILSSLITSEKMEDASREGFINATNGNTTSIAQKIETFIAVFKEPIGVNDVYDLVYIPAHGVKIYKNKSLHVTIPGLNFKQALFGIWLGDKPAQESLKKGLLGQ